MLNSDIPLASAASRGSSIRFKQRLRSIAGMFSGRWLAAFVLSWALHCENKRPALIWSCALLLAVTSCAALDHRTPGDKRGTPGDKRGENVDERRRSGTAEGAPPVGVAPPLPDGHGETSVSYEPAEPPMPFTWPADVLMVRF